MRNRPFPAWPVSGEEEECAISRVLRAGRWGRGEEVERFEEAFAEMHGCRFGVAVTSGTVALRIALWAAGIEAGDEVIVPSYTFLATASAVVEQNAAPVFADVERATYNLDPAAVEAAVTERTKAIVPVHFAGAAADMERIAATAAKHRLIVIEDAAHGHGGSYRGRGLGSFGHAGCFSFQSSKNLTCGEGGIVITNDESLAAEARSLHNFGRRPGRPWYEHSMMSSNYRMTEFQGAILNAQLARLRDQTAQRAANAARLAKRLRQIPGIEPQTRSDEEVVKAYHLFLFRYSAEAFGVPRSVFVRALEAEGIPATEGYLRPLHQQPIFKDGRQGPYTGAHPIDYAKTSCPVAERACASEGAWMLHNVLLGTEADTDAIADAFQKVWEHRVRLGEAGLPE